MEQLGELEKVANAFGYGAVPTGGGESTAPKEQSPMTQAALRELVREKLAEAMAKARPTGGSNMNKNHFKALQAFHKSSADYHKEQSARSTRKAKLFKSMGHSALETEFNDDARAEQGRMQAHNEAAAHWSKMNATVGHDDETAESAKVAKGGADDFWDRYVYGGPPMASGGLFGSGRAAELTKADNSAASGGLFE